jgi:hypothetical protein
MKDIWKDIPGYEGMYQCSNYGLIQSFDRYIPSAIKYQDRVKRKGKIIKPFFDRYGYLKLILYKNGIKKNVTIHRLVALSFISNPENKPQVNHINGIKSDNYVNNLEWVSNIDNIKHGVANKLFQYGLNHHFATLTTQELIDIKNKYIPRIYSSRKLAKEYNVSKTLILYIIKGKTRKYETANFK